MYRTNVRRFSVFLLLVAVVTLPATLGSVAAQAQTAAKPAAAAPAKTRIEFARMLPPETLVYVRAADAPLFGCADLVTGICHLKRAAVAIDRAGAQLEADTQAVTR